MMRTLLPVGMALVVLAGCSPVEDAGNVQGATQAASVAPKTIDQLPKDMPPEARRGAQAAMGQAQAVQQQANDPARVRAMQEMRRQHGG